MELHTKIQNLNVTILMLFLKKNDFNNLKNIEKAFVACVKNS